MIEQEQRVHYWFVCKLVGSGEYIRDLILNRGFSYATCGQLLAQVENMAKDRPRLENTDDADSLA